MVVSDLITQAAALSEEVYSDQDWLAFINMALDDLTPVAKHLTVLDNVNVPLVINGDATVSILPAWNVHEIVQIFYRPLNGLWTPLRRVASGDVLSRGWLRTVDTLRLQRLPSVSSGTLRLDYYKRLAHVIGSTSTPELPVEYHHLLVLYMCAKAQQREEELADKQDFYIEYLTGKQQFAVARVMEIEPWNRRYVAPARIFGSINTRQR